MSMPLVQGCLLNIAALYIYVPISNPWIAYWQQCNNYLPRIIGDSDPNGIWSALCTNGCSKSSEAVGRSFGFACKHCCMRSRAFLVKESGRVGGSPFPILKSAWC
uniref:Uncharacterized protein n=1 Tax=Opuntia streptacantha TaxID=393608 RepID=A0A7C9CVW0_OPUST